MSQFKDKILLVICHSYNTFQKDFINSISIYFKSIFVLVRYNPLAEISKYLPINSLTPYTYDNRFDFSNKPNNIKIVPTPIIYGPLLSHKKHVGKKHLRAVQDAIDRENIEFDMIHSLFIWSAGFVGSQLKRRYDKPFFLSALGYDIYKLPFIDDKWKNDIIDILNSSDYIFTVSNSCLDIIKDLKIKKPVRLISNGYNSDLFYPLDQTKCRKDLDLPLDKRILLNVGNLTEEKGQIYLIDAIKKIVENRDDILCIIIGSGKLKKNLQNKINYFGLKNYIKLIGRLPHNEISIWMNSADIFVLPSIRESYGIAQLEALACGKPVVATYNGGSEEIIINEKLGYLVYPKDSNALSNAINKSLKNKFVIDYIVNYASKFSWNSIAKQFYGVYDEAVYS